MTDLLDRVRARAFAAWWNQDVRARPSMPLDYRTQSKRQFTAGWDAAVAAILSILEQDNANG